jgi:Flp pilus assembly pilin Flp
MRVPMLGLAFITSFFSTANAKREERGASFTEYVVLLALVVAVIFVAWNAGLGDILHSKLDDIGGSVESNG